MEKGWGGGGGGRRGGEEEGEGEEQFGSPKRWTYLFSSSRLGVIVRQRGRTIFGCSRNTPRHGHSPGQSAKQENGRSW